MPLIKFSALACVLVLCTALSGCALWSSRKEPPATTPLQEATVEQLTGLLAEREGAIQSLKGLFRAHVQGPGIPVAQQVEGAVYFHRPDALRLQGFNRLGMKLFELALGDDRYSLRMINGRLLTGSIADLSRVEKIARPFRLSVLAMSGVVGTPSVQPTERVILMEDGDRYRLDVYGPTEGTVNAPTLSRRIWFDRRLLQVVKEERRNAVGQVDAVVEFEDFRPIDLGLTRATSTAHTASEKGTTMVPFRIMAHDGDGQGRIELKFHELTPNVPLTAEELRVAAEPFAAWKGLAS